MLQLNSGFCLSSKYFPTIYTTSDLSSTTNMLKKWFRDKSDLQTVLFSLRVVPQPVHVRCMKFAGLVLPVLL